MTQEQRSEIGKLIAYTASYYGRPLEKEILTMMVDDLQDMPFDDVKRAYSDYRRDPKNKVFPLPAQIIGIVAPQPNPEAVAREIIDRIKLAIQKHGWASSARARQQIGEQGWKVVEGLGGWVALCESDFVFNPATLAQARNRALDLVIYGSDKLAEALSENEVMLGLKSPDDVGIIHGLIKFKAP